MLRLKYRGLYFNYKPDRKRTKKLLGSYTCIHYVTFALHRVLIVYIGFHNRIKILRGVMEKFILRSLLFKHRYYLSTITIKLSYYFDKTINLLFINKLNYNYFSLILEDIKPLDLGITTYNHFCDAYANDFLNFNFNFKHITLEMYIFLSVLTKDNFPLFYYEFDYYDPLLYDLTTYSKFEYFLLSNRLFIPMFTISENDTNFNVVLYLQPIISTYHFTFSSPISYNLI